MDRDGHPSTNAKGVNLTANTGPAKLLVKSALERVLAKSANRLDVSARIERVKAAALMECADKGYTGLTIANIAKRAKVSTSTIYAEYPDRDKLLVAAMEMLFALLAGDVIEVPPAEDPQERVEQLQIAHGQVYAEPLTIWLTRLHVTLAWAGHVHLRQIGLHVFRGIDAFWTNFLSDFERQGHLSGIEPSLVVPWLLGPVERCTIISRLACGDDDPRRPSLAEVAKHSAAALFQLWGRPSGSASYGDSSVADRLLKEMPAVSGNGDLDNAAKSARNNPREQKASITRAAKALCSQHGYEAANVRDIAARAGVSTATLYSHFADKTDLFCSALEAEFAQHGDYRAGAGPVALDAALMQIAARAASPDWIWIHNVLMASTISDDPRVVAIGRKCRDTAEDFLAGTFAAKPSALTLNMLLGAIERSGVLALILFGAAAVDLPALARLAAFTARCYEAQDTAPASTSS
jgi:AcrR family transcriptional regulator